MEYQKSKLVYQDYRWTARADYEKHKFQSTKHHRL